MWEFVLCKSEYFYQIFCKYKTEKLPFSIDARTGDVFVIVVGDNFDVVDDIVEVMLQVGVVTLFDSSPASAHTSDGDGCVSFARFSSVGFVSTRGKVHIDGSELGSDETSVLSEFVVVEFTDAVTVSVVVSIAFELFSDDVVDTSGGVHIELDE